MKFECQKCGACCHGDWWDSRTLGLQLTDEEISRISDALGAPASSFLISRFTVGVHPTCMLFDVKSNTCKVHDVKPEHCKKWPFGFQQMKNPDNLRTGARLCPGITLESGDLPSESTD